MSHFFVKKIVFVWSTLKFCGSTSYTKTKFEFPLLEKLYIWVKAHKNSRLPTQLIIFSGFRGKNIKNCPPSKLFLFTSFAHVNPFMWTSHVSGRNIKRLACTLYGVGPWAPVEGQRTPFQCTFAYGVGSPIV